MIRTQIQLSKEDYETLRQVAAQEGRSMADCIREALGLFFRRSRAGQDNLEEVAGKFRPRPVNRLKRHDRWLAEAVIASKASSKKRRK